MKIIYVVIIFFICNIAHTQDIDTVFTKNQVLRISYVIDSLQSEVNYLQQKNYVNETIIGKYDIMQKSTNEIIESYKQYNKIQLDQINALQNNVTTYQSIIKNNRPSIFQHPVFWFIAGAGTIYLSSKIVANVK